MVPRILAGSEGTGGRPLGLLRLAELREAGVVRASGMAESPVFFGVRGDPVETGRILELEMVIEGPEGSVAGIAVVYNRRRLVVAIVIGAGLHDPNA